MNSLRSLRFMKQTMQATMDKTNDTTTTRPIPRDRQGFWFCGRGDGQSWGVMPRPANSLQLLKNKRLFSFTRVARGIVGPSLYSGSGW